MWSFLSFINVNIVKFKEKKPAIPFYILLALPHEFLYQRHFGLAETELDSLYCEQCHLVVVTLYQIEHAF